MTMEPNIDKIVAALNREEMSGSTFYVGWVENDEYVCMSPASAKALLDYFVRINKFMESVMTDLEALVNEKQSA